MKRTLILAAILVLASCGGGDAADPTAATTTTTVAPTTTTTTTPPTTTPVVVPDSGCTTTFGATAWIEVGLQPACFLVAAYQQLVIENGSGAAIDVTWAGVSEAIAADATFVTQGLIRDVLQPGTHRLDSPDVAVNLVVVDPGTSRFVAEPMYLRRWGPVNVGDSVEAAEAALGADLVFPDEELFPDGACLFGYVDGDPYSPGFMVLDRTRIVRMDATAFEHQTASGIKYGSTADDVVAAYGDLIERSPHAYVDGEYLTLVPQDEFDKDYRVVFETIRDEFAFVNGFRNGLVGPAGWIEGCL